MGGFAHVEEQLKRWLLGACLESKLRGWEAMVLLQHHQRWQ